MSKKAREKPAEAGSASVSPYGSVLSYEQVTSQPNRLINLIWPEYRTWFIGPWFGFTLFHPIMWTVQQKKKCLCLGGSIGRRQLQCPPFFVRPHSLRRFKIVPSSRNLLTHRDSGSQVLRWRLRELPSVQAELAKKLNAPVDTPATSQK